MTDPFQTIADAFGITPEDVGEMNREQLAALRTRMRAQLDQTEAALRDTTTQETTA